MNLVVTERSALISRTLHDQRLSWADKVAYLAYVLHDPKALEDCPVFHLFQPGFYIRETHVPGGQIFIGRVHRNGHVVKLLTGIGVVLEEGRRRIFRAPAVIHTQPGFQMCGYTVTPVFVQTWHPTSDAQRDVNTLELRDFEPAEATLERGRLAAEYLLRLEAV